MKVIVVEDFLEVADAIRLCLNLRWPDCDVLCTARGGDLMQLVERESPSLVLLDLELEDMRGLDALRQLRAFSSVPLIIVSGYGDEISRIKGLEEGADDYITKPFSHTELLARVQAVLRRVQHGRAWPAVGVVHGEGIEIDLERRRLHVEGRRVELTHSEWSLLSYLVKNRGQVVSTHNLANTVWGSSYVEGAAIRMCIGRLRRKLACTSRPHNVIRSHRGAGYSLELPRETFVP